MDLSTLQSKTRYLLGELTSAQYSDANLNRALNDYYHRGIAIALRSSGEWEVDGEVATANIVANQQEYALSTDIISLKRIELNFTGDTDGWVVANPLDMRNKQTAISNETASSNSTKVRIFDNSIFLEDYPDSNVTGGIKIFYSDEPTELSSSSDEPNLLESTQIYLVYGACLDYTISKGMNSEIRTFKVLLDEAKEEIKKVYSNRLPMRRPRISVKSENYN